MLKVILIESGKGGTGKSSLTASAGAALAQLGRKVLVMDGDCGLRNLDLVLGMSDAAVFSFADAARDTVPLTRAAAAHPVIAGLHLLTAPAEPPALTNAQMEHLSRSADEAGFDYLLIDGPAGLPEELSLYAHIATQGIVVTMPDPASIRGAERVARRMEQSCIMRIRLVVNRVRPRLIRHGLAANIDDVMDAAGLPLLGLVPEDEDVIACAGSGKSVVQVKKTGAAQAYRNIARRLEGERLPLMKF